QVHAARAPAAGVRGETRAGPAQPRRRSRSRPARQGSGPFRPRGQRAGYPQRAPRDESGADVEWTYHMAPVVLVDGPGGATQCLVLDPSLSRDRLAGPISVDAWHRQVGTPAGGAFRDQTALGQAPRNPYTGQRYPGDGYLPGVPTVAQADARGFML